MHIIISYKKYNIHRDIIHEYSIHVIQVIRSKHVYTYKHTNNIQPYTVCRDILLRF